MMAWFYALFLALNTAFLLSDPNTLSLFGGVFCGCMFIRELVNGR